MFRRQELFIIILVQAAVTLVLSVAEPNSGIIHPGLDSSKAALASYRHPQH